MESNPQSLSEKSVKMIMRGVGGGGREREVKSVIGGRWVTDVLSSQSTFGLFVLSDISAVNMQYLCNKMYWS